MTGLDLGGSGHFQTCLYRTFPGKREGQGQGAANQSRPSSGPVSRLHAAPSLSLPIYSLFKPAEPGVHLVPSPPFREEKTQVSEEERAHRSHIMIKPRLTLE